MAYTINRYDGSTLTVVEDGTIDQNTDLKLVGRNYAGYGEIQNENFVFLLENFANINPPPKPVSGQLWFDSSASKLKFYDGGQFRSTGGAETNTDQPSGLTEGDFWWDTSNEQLYAFNGTDFILIGPQDAGEGITQMQSRTVIDTNGVARSVIVSILNDQVVHIISNEEFFIQQTSENAIPGFDIIKKGVTLVNTQNATGGVTTTDHLFWGTVSNALQLGGVDAGDFVKQGDAGFDSLVSFSDFGLAVGNSNDLKVTIENGDEAAISNEVGSVIKFKATNESGTLKDTLRIRANSVLPGKTDGVKEAVAIGAMDDTFEDVYADNFWGVSEQANSLLVGGNKRFGDVQATSNSVAVRDSSGDLRVNLLRGTALAARYADLAEIYSTDRKYPVGTVLCICVHEGHEAEQAQNNDIPIGVVSLKPAYIMNSEAEGQPVALTGRTPVRITGAVQKGDAISVADNGTAVANGSGARVGIALESSSIVEEKLVECFIKT